MTFWKLKSYRYRHQIERYVIDILLIEFTPSFTTEGVNPTPHSSCCIDINLLCEITCQLSNLTRSRWSECFVPEYVIKSNFEAQTWMTTKIRCVQCSVSRSRQLSRMFLKFSGSFTFYIFHCICQTVNSSRVVSLASLGWYERKEWGEKAIVFHLKMSRSRKRVYCERYIVNLIDNFYRQNCFITIIKEKIYMIEWRE